ncbi:uncharacterized protein GIQ15_00306 [Arthroderma uncinatum]|uniref:uncharacterized protein n=1 Tax=Arthroderma uncinatum TaxID=74035 RepID=UPI00144A56CF|nr:uncharacterized protein GIQ15_00306 [Arthroderma uncinatum]KAF3490789.1 hypothetical protein GIQ15_00306 [Arthroderma uncinatum]
MYLRATHAEGSIEALFGFIKQNPLGVLTTAISSPSHPLLQASHIPWVLDELTTDPDAPNPQSKAIIEAAAGQCPAQLTQDVMILFTGSHHHYVTPKFYTETKPSTGKVVPTWNYAAVQVYGKATVYVDSRAAETSSYLSQQIHDLSQLCETSQMGYTGQDGQPEPWKVSDAPEAYINIMKKAIIGIEVTVESIGGKFKMSQEDTKGDREGVINGFASLGTDVGTHMSSLVKQRGDIYDSSK